MKETLDEKLDKLEDETEKFYFLMTPSGNKYNALVQLCEMMTIFNEFMREFIKKVK